MPSPLVSAFLLVRDEGATLARALRSLEPLADELIVGVDTQTTDDSATIAHDAGARVVPLAFDGHFGRAHNSLDRLGRGVWGFKLDGHEYLQADHARALRECLEDGAAGCRALACRLVTTEAEGGVRAMVIRAWKRGSGVRYEGAIHEQIVGWGRRFHARPDLVIHHDRPEARIVHRQAQRVDRDLRWLLTEVAERPGDAAAWFHLAQLHHARAELPEAAAAAARAWQLARDHADVFRCQVALLRARVALHRTDVRRAAEHVRQALAARWDVPEAYCVMAEVALAGRPPDLHEARAWLRCALAVPQVPWEFPAQVRHHTWWPCRQLAAIARSLGDLDEAESWSQRAARLGPRAAGQGVPGP